MGFAFARSVWIRLRGKRTVHEHDNPNTVFVGAHGAWCIDPNCRVGQLELLVAYDLGDVFMAVLVPSAGRVTNRKSLVRTGAARSNRSNRRPAITRYFLLPNASGQILVSSYGGEVAQAHFLGRWKRDG